MSVHLSLNKITHEQNLFESLYLEFSNDYISDNLSLQRNIKFGKRLDIEANFLFFEEDFYDKILFQKDEIKNLLNRKNSNSPDRKLIKPQAKLKSNTMIGVKQAYSLNTLKAPNNSKIISSNKFK